MPVERPFDPKTAPILVPSRDATPKEREIWERAKREVRRLNLTILQGRIMLTQVIDAHNIANTNGVNLGIDISGLARNIAWLEQQGSEYAQAVSWVDQRKLAIAVHGGDVDIIYPEQYQPFDGIVVVAAVAGVALLVGFIALNIVAMAKAQEQNAQLRQAKKSADEILCSDASSPQCQQWQRKKQSTAYKEKDGMIKSLGKNIVKLGKKVGGGLSMGVALAVPLVAFMLARGKR